MAAKLARERRHESLFLVLFLLLFTALPSMGQNRKAPPKPTNEECLICHGDAGLATEREGKPVSLAVDPDKFKISMHGSILTCVDCHADVKSSPHEARPAKVDCSTCHADQQAAYDRSYHAKAIKAGNL